MKKSFRYYQNLARHYHYMVVDISEDNETGYEAVIPKFPKIFIVADTPKELGEVVLETVAEEIQYLEKNGKPVPEPDSPNTAFFSGKFILRIDPGLHERLKLLSQAAGKTLNGYISHLLEERVENK
jgi:predicted HicB family RNase H-like nuclease